ncbi:actin-7-related [Anaeramoeba flamelloides]|uniref:Actin-7-related n=1 Tax=Anaeramoeba flamelloides TaxID=1746091 RepID=A0ABQ8YIW5_9EUKA|nr:actin-7-related [Anaeramoeba flamelloides]
MSKIDSRFRPIVIDCGSGMIKSGFAGDVSPTSVFPTIIGRPKYDNCLIGMEKKQYYVGQEAINKRGILSLKYPIEHGKVCHWDDLDKILNHTFYDELKICPKSHPVLITEKAYNCKVNRELLTQIMFETFNTPGMYLEKSSVLSLYASGKSTGIVLDLGETYSQAVPVYEDKSISNLTSQIKIGGKSITEYLIRILEEREHYFTSPAEKEIVKDIKEKFCYVAYNFKKEMKKTPLNVSKNEKRYELPDGQRLQMGNECFRAPELLFKPSFFSYLTQKGIHELINESIMKCDKDIRKILYKNIAISGGSSMFPGFIKRLKKEIKKLAPRKMKVNIIPTAHERINLPWVGGSIFASLSNFNDLLISNEEYQEMGPSIVHRKCF